MATRLFSRLKPIRRSAAIWTRWLLGAALCLLANRAPANPDRLLDRLERERRAGFVFDFARVVPAPQRRAMESVLLELEQKTGAQVKVVVLPSLDGNPIEDFATRLYERWKIGRAGKDDGILLLASMEDRRARIEVGYGLEGILPDARAGRILDQAVLPLMRANRPGEALTAGVESVAGVIAQQAGVRLLSLGSAGGGPTSGSEEPVRVHPLLALLFAIIMGYIAIRHPILFLMLLSIGSRGGGGFGGGGFGGGFGGFGGGRSGGGGASRGW